MPSIRGQKLTKLSVSEINNIAEERKHKILKLTTSQKDANVVPKQSRIHLHCQKCNHKWDAKVYAYLQSTGPSLGCRKCYEMLIQDPSIYPNSPCRMLSTANAAQPVRKSGRKVLRERFKKSKFGHITNLKQLIVYLKSDLNIYNTKVLEILFRNEGLKKQNSSLKELYPNQTSKHHVIPIHDGGSPDSWNLVEVTKKEHHELHKLRYKVYSQKGDLQATYATRSDVIRYEHSSDNENGDISKYEKKDPKIIAGLLNIPLEVSNALKRGMILTHKDGYTITIHPNTLKTTHEIKNVFLDLLPDGHQDKERILKNKTSINYIRSLIVTAFQIDDSKNLVKKVYSAYGFTVQPLY